MQEHVGSEPPPGPPVALVSGGSRGLGLAVARELAGRGYRLAICARDGQELGRACHDLLGRGAEVLAHTADLTEPGAPEEFVTAARQRFGRIDWLVNNAGIIQVGPMSAMREDDFRAAMEVMFFAPLALVRAVLPVMRAQGDGRIVTVTSIGGKVAAPHLLPYVCAKFAAVGLGEGLHAELAGTGISATTVVPGLMRTGSDRRALFRGREEREYAWFSTAAALPVLSADADRAARAIVRAGLLRRSEVTVGLPAALLSRAAGLAPGLSARACGLVARALPRTDSAATEREPLEGHRAAGRLGGRVRWIERAVTALNNRAARRLNEEPG
ncbi:SDR family NAD(P)-dependent oxidoreductase [Streptomyces sp. TP-A0874]|uniref:SDR family NAD(P)-dependent oxidoreductase n=1 Tax=Streptomyces sp. TP-A0874 TaxID=549819 RepID=UPI000853702C|nr:SDR family NAD(P)-dependent oxidoreductase [Streptomyces sp. TP-A0874]